MILEFSFLCGKVCFGVLFLHTDMLGSSRCLWLLLRPCLNNRIQLQGHHQKKAMELLGWVQGRATKIIRGLQHTPYEERLREFVLFSLEK